MNETRESKSALIWGILLVALLFVAAGAGAIGWMVVRQQIVAETQATRASQSAIDHGYRPEASQAAALAEAREALMARDAALAAQAADDNRPETDAQPSQANGEEDDANRIRPTE